MVTVGAVVLMSALAGAQAIPASPEGKSQAQVGGKYVKGARGGQTYEGGKWIEITYGRPILRGRDSIFGTGADYGKELNGGAPVWRAGANVSTRIRTEGALLMAGKTLPAGEYSLFIELKENAWTLIVSNWAAQKTYDPKNMAELWGSYNYTPDKDVLRAPMTHTKNAMSVEQLTWSIVNVTPTGGELAIMWGKEIATVAFKLG
jgi:hypothetical protein